MRGKGSESEPIVEEFVAGEEVLVEMGDFPVTKRCPGKVIKISQTGILVEIIDERRGNFTRIFDRKRVLKKY